MKKFVIIAALLMGSTTYHAYSMNTAGQKAAMLESLKQAAQAIDSGDVTTATNILYDPILAQQISNNPSSNKRYKLLLERLNNLTNPNTQSYQPTPTSRRLFQ